MFAAHNPCCVVCGGFTMRVVGGTRKLLPLGCFPVPLQVWVQLGLKSEGLWTAASTGAFIHNSALGNIFSDLRVLFVVGVRYSQFCKTHKKAWTRRSHIHCSLGTAYKEKWADIDWRWGWQKRCCMGPCCLLYQHTSKGRPQIQFTDALGDSQIDRRWEAAIWSGVLSTSLPQEHLGERSSQ